MKRCPNCNHKLYRTVNGCYCKFCGFENRSTTHTDRFAKDLRYGSVNSNAIPLIDYHNTAYKFKILGQDINVKFPIEKHMRGWVQQWIYEDGVKILKTPENIIVFIDKRFKERIDVKGLEALDEKIRNIAIDAARKVQEKYLMVLDLNNAQPLRKEIKLVEGFKSALMFNTDKVKVVYPDGTIEFIGAEALQSFKNFFNNMAALDKVQELENNMAEFAANWQFHKQLLLDMQATQIAMQKTLCSKPEGLTVKIRRMFGLWLAKLKPKTTTDVEIGDSK